MKIIDFRFRPHTPEAITGMLDQKNIFRNMFEYFRFKDRAYSLPLEAIVEEMDALGVDKGVITSRDAETTYGAPSGNPGVAEMTRRFPDKFIGIAGLDPHKGMGAIEELKRMTGDHGMRGAATDPCLARIPASHALYYPIYAKCCELGLPVVITTGPNTLVPGTEMDHAHPRHIDRVARDFPGLKIVISHGCYPWVAEAVMMVQRNANVYMDISEYEEMPLAEGYIQAANALIPDKLLFASAHPFMDYKGQIALYKRLPFTREALQAVMYSNAARLLGLAA
uniref:Amidohydrolase n=1 Tax=Fundidesulfovibrio putealis TaxID=270496 RepID=A0A7C3WD36_9BACT